MKYHYLLASALGAGILAKATVDLRRVYLKRWYAYLKCLTEKFKDIDKGEIADINRIKADCYSEAILKYPLPTSVYSAGIAFFLPLSIAFLYEAFSLTKGIDKEVK